MFKIIRNLLFFSLKNSILRTLFEFRVDVKKIWKLPGVKTAHGVRTPREEIAFTARPKIHSHSQSFRYGQSIFCLPHRPNFSDIFNLCLHWVFVVRGCTHAIVSQGLYFFKPLLLFNTK